MTAKFKDWQYWCLFLSVNAASLVVYYSLWESPYYFETLIFLAIFSVLLAVSILAKSRLSIASIGAVVGAMLVGQWWLIFVAFAFITWTINGFAP